MPLHLVSHKEQYLMTWTLLSYLCNSIEQSHSWEANRFSVRQEIPRILCVYKCPPPVPILSQINPFTELHNYSYINHTSCMGDNRNENRILMRTDVHRRKSQRNVSSKALTSQTAHLQDISNSTPTRDFKEHTCRRPHAAHIREILNSILKEDLKQHTFRRPTTHLQNISYSTPTRDLKEHTFRRPHAAHPQETSNSTHSGDLKQHT
jgi:hypothetical protein